MGAFNELITTESGLLSLGVIVFVLVIGAYLYVWVRRQIARETSGS